ncbi:MAG: sulfotransferase [Rhodospirillales bacterium]|nr:sulfotransferase [Rhodospirillales bacterium]
MTEYRNTQERLTKVFEKDIVFIVGATRWGTAWVQQCLDAHPEICCKGEGHFTDTLFPLMADAFDDYNAKSEIVGNRLQRGGQAGNAAGFTFEDVHHLMTTAIGLALSRWSDGQNVKVIAEKTPEHIVQLDLLAKAVPTLKVVHVYRDGRDEAVSAWDFNNSLSKGEFAKSYPAFGDYAQVFGGNWAGAIHASKRFERAHQSRCIHVRAEDLQGDQVAALGPLLAFLGVNAEPEVIKDCADAAWEAAPLDIDPGTWKKKFAAPTAKFFTREYGELLKLLGYDSS